MAASDNLAQREEFAPILKYADLINEQFAIIRGRNIVPPKRDAVLGKHEALRVTSAIRKDLSLTTEVVAYGKEPEETEPEVTYIFHRAPASALPLVRLSKAYLKNLKWCEALEGSVLVVRTISEPCFVEGALSAVVEDETDAVHNLRVYNMLTKGRNERDVLPQGIVLAIKEPYSEAASEATSGIRVDHPSDLVYLSEGDTHFPHKWKVSVTKETRCEHLKAAGNIHFQQKIYRLAVSAYTSGLHYNPAPSLQTALLLNRAQSFIELGCYNEAAADAQRVINASDTPNEKALFRCGRALYECNRYDDALDRCEKLAAAFPQNREAKELMSRCKERLEEQRWGKYDWAEIIAEAKNGAPRQKVSDYIGPIVGEGDGLFRAKQSIKAGELLMCSKAFATLYPDDLRGERGALIYDATRRVLGQAEGWKMTQAVAEKIASRNSSDAITPLLKGWQVFGDDQLLQASNVDGRPVTDIHVLDAVREVHAIPFSAIHPLVPTLQQPAQGLGLWPLAARAHLKHSCLPNASHSFLGDLLILRACRDIKKNDLISLSHVNASIPLPERKEELSRPPGTPCDCAFCAVEEKEGQKMRQKRVDLVERVKEVSERAPPQSLRTDAGRDEKNSPSHGVVREVAKEVAKLCDELEATYTDPAYIAPRFPLLEPLSYLFSCYLYLGPESTEDALKVNARYFGALGFEFNYTSVGDEKGGDVSVHRHGLYHPYVVKTLVQQASVCWQLGKRRTANGWRNIAESAMEIVAGHRKLFQDGFAMVFASLKWEL